MSILGSPPPTPPANPNDQEPQPSPPIPLAEFLVKTPPNREVKIARLGYDFSEGRLAGSGGIFNDDIKNWLLDVPEITLHCSHDTCNGERTFVCSSDERCYLPKDDFRPVVLVYKCRNCQKHTKTYAITVGYMDHDGNGRAYKLGEKLPFGPHTPSRVIDLIGPDRDLYLKGRRSESQGLGIGAYSYYRRVVENQKNRLLDEIIKVACRVGTSQDAIDKLEGAKTQTQFSRAVEDVKDAVPEVIKIDGHNPLTLLHQALSEGLHQHDDETCLKEAGCIRLVLTSLAEKIGQALKDETELKQAVGRLTRGSSQ